MPQLTWTSSMPVATVWPQWAGPYLTRRETTIGGTSHSESTFWITLTKDIPPYITVDDLDRLLVIVLDMSTGSALAAFTLGSGGVGGEHSW